MRAEARKSAVKKVSHKNARRRRESMGKGASMGRSLREGRKKTTGAVGLVKFVTWVLERGSNRTGFGE
jgi:hypothetical protein